MNWTAIILAGASSATGSFAAGLWYQASTIQIDPRNRSDIEPDIDRQTVFVLEEIIALKVAAMLSAKVNRWAALWTAVTVALGGLASIANVWPPN